VQAAAVVHFGEHVGEQAAGWGSLTPVIQHDWEAVFLVPWLPERPLPESVRRAQEWRKSARGQSKALATLNPPRGAGASDRVGAS